MAILIFLILCFAYVNCQKFPECNGKPSGTYLVDYRKNSDCRSYIYCDGNNSFRDMCSLGLAFNLIKSSCDLKENVFCDEDFNDDMFKIDSPMKSKSVVFQKRSDLDSSKQRPTPPGRTLKTVVPTRNSKRPVPTRKPSQPPTKLSTLMAYTTRRNTPKTSILPSKRPTSIPKLQPAGTKSPVQIPTPPGGQHVPGQTKKPAMPNLPDSTDSSRLTTESDFYISTKKPLPNSNAPSSTTTSTTTTNTFEIEEVQSSTIKNDVISSSVQEECNKKKAGSFADPDDCRFYYRCVRGILNKQECPKGFGWDTKSKMCTSKGCLK